jgi:hypothetical protein
MTRKRLPDHFQVWLDARNKFHLSHAQVQMARELGLNPKKLGKLANHKQEPWKMPLPQFIEHLYRKRFGRDCPAVVISIEEKAEMEHRKNLARRARKQAASAQTGETCEELKP